MMRGMVLVSALATARMAVPFRAHGDRAHGQAPAFDYARAEETFLAAPPTPSVHSARFASK
jgi:hypothetical protein